MKNLLRGSLLTLIFVGMSGFTTSSNVLENIPPLVVNCDKLASEAASDAAGFGFSEDAQARIFVKTYFTCLQDENGLSVFEFLFK